MTHDFTRIYHYHIRKCAGTSINVWMESQVADHRRWDPAWTRRFNAALSQGDDAAIGQPGLKAEFAACAHSVFRWADSIGDHAPLRPYAPPGTFCFTTLRDPVARIVSQVADWRRLSLADYPDLSSEMTAAMRDAQTLPLADFLAKRGSSTLRYLFDNHITRALAAARLGFGPFTQIDCGALADVARLAMHADFHVVGLAERHAETQAVIADILAFAPPSTRRLNVTGSEQSLASERSQAADVLEMLTRFDRPLYAEAVETFEKQVEVIRSAGEAGFDRHACDAVQRLEGSRLGNNTVFSVRGPLVGSGFHPRDAAGLPNCRVWSGPETRSLVYLPVPAGVPIKVKLWIHGYAADRQRDTLRVSIDDVPVPHRFEAAEGWRETVVVDVTPRRSWLKLATELDETLTSDQAGGSERDDRQRGFSFDLYGWQPI